MENAVDWENEVWEKKCGNEGSEAKQLQQGYFIRVEEVGLEGHREVSIQSSNSFRKWEKGEKEEFRS